MSVNEPTPSVAANALIEVALAAGHTADVSAAQVEIHTPTGTLRVWWDATTVAEWRERAGNNGAAGFKPVTLSEARRLIS